MKDNRPTGQEDGAASAKGPTGSKVAFRLIAVGLILVASIGMAVYIKTSPPQKAVPAELQGVLRPAPKELQDFTLIRQDGQPFTLEDLKGKWTMLFFGYTYCPDICPTALAMLSAVFRDLEQTPDALADTQVVFVSVDTKRDPPEKLAEYVAYFDPRFSGATGEVDEIDGLVRQVGAGYQIEPEESPGNYLISHSGSIFLVDPQARLVGTFSFPLQPETITNQYLKIREL